MSHLNVVMSLKDFASYIQDILDAEDSGLFIEEQKVKGITLKKFKNSKDIDDLRAKNLRFFILAESSEKLSSDDIYDDLETFIICGEGGRESKDSVERISLRVLSKSADKQTKKIFNSIKSKLKKDSEIGMGVKGGSSLHNSYFYQKKLVGKKTFKTDFHNEKAPLIEVRE